MKPKPVAFFLLFFFPVIPMALAQDAFFREELIFPLQEEHVHGSTIVELPGGDLLAGWFQGHGERWADDVRIMGARKKKGAKQWSEPFVLADTRDFPDINPVLFLDRKERLWLVWYTVIANQWETSLLKYRISERYQGMEGAPEWSWQEVLHVKAGDKTERGIQPGDAFVESVRQQIEDYASYIASDTAQAAAWRQEGKEILALAAGEDMLRDGRLYQKDGSYTSRQLGYPFFRRMGWQTRSKPFVSASGRIILPLYSDGFNFSLMAFTDDGGASWDFSNPLVGAGNVQPAIAMKRSGQLVAYMRDNGPPPMRLHISSSGDTGKTWTPVRDTQIPNPGSAADIVTLENGHWVLVSNDLEDGRHRLSVALSEDEGKTWPWSRTIVNGPEDARAHYPALVEGADGILHLTYSYFLPDQAGKEQKTIKYASFNESWIKAR